MLYVISYDVSDDGRRRRVFEALKDFGRRVQYSVFECDTDAAGLRELAGRIGAEIDPESDSCRIYRLCKECEGVVEVMGTGDRYARADYYVI